MCLAVPMEIESLPGNDTAIARAGDSKVEINVSLLENPKIGDYVIIHAGFAIETLDFKEAEERIELFRQIDTQNNPGQGSDVP